LKRYRNGSTSIPIVELACRKVAAVLRFFERYINLPVVAVDVCAGVTNTEKPIADDVPVRA
jgi:hypothetical protein